MAIDLRQQLQATLGGAYTLERELGGGGMSRVFVAEETALRRKVVVKVLSPELTAGVNVERFDREILVAARLQHPHIVPVLTAGATDGLPFYMMPFVEGESVRVKLARLTILSIGDAVAILRDLAKALAYAHDHGVVHRDIKPDNVLVTGGSATVTDFGIAKALTASRTLQPNSTLTQVGTSIGTPAYMSPEQAAGDPATDHRTDIYSFGCVAYELLAGRPPFTSRTPTKLLAAHMGETPEPISALRSDTPPALADLVMRCLAKGADARPQRASDLVQLLESVTSGGTQPAMPSVLLGGRQMLSKALAVYAAAFVAVAIVAKAAIVGIGLPDWVFPGAIIVMALVLPAILFTGYVQRVTRLALTATPTYTPGGTPSMQHGTMATLAIKASPHLSWRRTTLAGAIALAAFVLLVGGFMLLRALGIGPAGSFLASGTLKHREPLLIADFKATGPDSSLSDVLAEAMRTSLGESRVVSVAPLSTIAEALKRMKLPASAKVDAALARDIARREGIRMIVTGTITSLTGGYVLSASLVDASTGDQLATYQETVDGAKELIVGIDRLARKLRGRIGESLKVVRSDPPLERVTTGSLEALQKFAESRRAYNQNDYATGVRLLREAVGLDSTFAIAYRQLAFMLSDGRLATLSERRSVFAKALQYQDRLPETERLALIAYDHSEVGTRPDRAKAAVAYEQLLRRYPEAPDAAVMLGNIYDSRREYARAESTFRVAMQYEPNVQFAWFNIIRPQVNQGHFADARQSLDAARRQFPALSRAIEFDAEILYAEGNPDSAASLFRSQFSSTNPRDQANAHYNVAQHAMRSGKFREMWREITQVRRIDSARGAPPQRLEDSLLAAQMSLWFFDRPADGLRQLDAALARNPLATQAVADRPYLRVARLYAMMGRVDRAREILGEYERVVRDPIQLDGALPQRTEVGAWIALAEGRPLEAVRLFRDAESRPDGPVSACATCTLSRLARAFDRADMPDSAIAAFESFLAKPEAYRLFNSDIWDLAFAQRRLGELYEAKGDRAKAASHYLKFVELWKDADPELQPRVAEARERLARLSDTERR